MSLDKRIIELTKVFIQISDIKNEIDYTFTRLDERITKVKELYKEFIKHNKDASFTFGLDSFHFQNKMVDLEYEDMQRVSSAILNRMYCEYYKLYKLIVFYIRQTITEEKILTLVQAHSTFPIYKDLEPFKKYEFSVIQSLHETIIELMMAINSTIVNLEHELMIHSSKRNIGINIDNFINTFSFNILLIREKVVLFINYIDFFHSVQIKLLKRFSKKLVLMFKQLNEDIKFEDADYSPTSPTGLKPETVDFVIEQSLNAVIIPTTITDSSLESISFTIMEEVSQLVREKEVKEEILEEIVEVEVKKEVVEVEVKKIEDISNNVIQLYVVESLIETQPQDKEKEKDKGKSKKAKK